MALFLIFLIGMENGKLIAIELLGLFQFSLFNLTQTEHLNPL